MSAKNLKSIPVELTTTRNIVTRYYFRREVRKINRGMHADRAILSCIDHLQKNHYQASIAEIVDETTHTLLAVITRNIVGRITIVYQGKDLFIAGPVEGK